MVFVSILALACFQDVTVQFYIGSQEASFSGKQSLSLTELEEKECSDFIGLKVSAEVEIGDVIFESAVQEYFAAEIEFEMTTSSSTQNLSTFSIAEYKILSVEDSLTETGVVDTLLNNWFDFSYCFKKVDVMTSHITRSIELRLEKHDVCNFVAAGDAELALTIHETNRRHEILSATLTGGFATWPVTFECTTNCAESYDLLSKSLFPVVFFSITGTQSATKNAIELNAVGDANIVPTVFTSQISITQPITLYTDIATTTALENVRIRFLTIMIDFYQTVVDDTFEWDPNHDEFVIQVCINQNADFSGARYCFAKKYKEAFVLPYFSIYCTEDALISEQECNANLVAMESFELNFTVMVSQTTYMAGEVVEKYNFQASAELHCYYPMTARITEDKFCLSMALKERCSSVSKATDLQIEFDGFSLVNRYNFPNSEQKYCFDITREHIRVLEKLDSTEVHVTVGESNFPIIYYEMSVPRPVFNIAFAVAGVAAVVCLPLLLFLFKIPARSAVPANA